MIGAKSLAIGGFAAITIAAAAAGGLLDPAYLRGLTAAACITIGLFAGLTGALLSAAWRPEVPSRIGVGRGRVRELPALVQRALVVAALGCIGAAAFTNETTARLLGLPSALAEPSRSGHCPPPPEDAETEAEPAPPPPVVAPEQPGCALVKRAFELGYSKSLGSCAPQVIAAAPVPEEIAKLEPCTRRQLDEPFLHFAWRRVGEHGGDLGTSDPVSAIEHEVDDFRKRVDEIDLLITRLRHAIGGSPHAAHHVWINLPDPHAASSWLDELLDPTPCDERYRELPTWPDTALSASALVEHVIGQLLFATRFGKPPASCRDVAVHWGAPADACARLRDDPTAFLADAGALASVRDVLERRRISPVAAPPAGVVVSLHCFVVDEAGTGAATADVVAIDGEYLEVREVRAPAVRAAGAGPIDTYAQLAALLAGGPYTGAATGDAVPPPPPVPADLESDTYLLTRLDALQDADPFLGVRWPLEREDLLDVYPFHRHLHAFVDAFRRRYVAQRGRL